MIVVKTTFAIPSLAQFEIDSFENYNLPDGNGGLKHPDTFYIYEIPSEALLFHKIDKKIDLGTVTSPQEFNRRIQEIIQSLEKNKE